ncbi:hypothetical protein L596_020692 [Steinernema carpocapsae]|uniref:PAP-associated domain-containing protein n=1 Tax=Steinernema carpocapsae TaxID=34508 RepID=A0A4U5MUI2_STECR|nr:hypothetical protein L596_020692 [Steinernema carpocapsae]
MTEWPKLNLVVKRWATKLGILNSFDGLLSSFSFTMMVIHFLQSVCTPPIVPNLDKLFPSAFERSHVWTLHHNECIDMAIKKRMPENGLSVAELFLGFIAYYASFPWDDMGIDVRHGKRHERNYSLEDEAEFIVIEEPYERYNSARTVCSEYDEYAISQSIKAVARNIFEKGSLEPEVLF